MTAAHLLHSRLAEVFDGDRYVEFLQNAVAVESITGNEASFASWLGERMSELGLSPRQDFFAEGRPNIYAMREGSCDGPHLLFAGHTDTVHVRGWAERWKDDIRENPFSGAVVDGQIWGRGASDLKGGICASLCALDLVERAGLSLCGDLGFAFVGDEESGEPGTGVSAGARHFAASVAKGDIRKPDFAVYVEPTRLAVYPAQMGFFIADVAICGKSAYFGLPEQGIDAVKAAHKALAAVWKHSDEIGALASHDLVGHAFALVTEISGGGYIAVPGECRFSVIRKLLPGECLDMAAAELETAVRQAVAESGVDISFSYPAGRDHRLGGQPSQIDPDLRPVKLLRDAMAAAGGGKVEGAPYWSEASIFVNEIGCPTAYCAPGDIATCHSLEERIDIFEYLAAIRAYAEFAASYCGTDSKSRT